MVSLLAAGCPTPVRIATSQYIRFSFFICIFFVLTANFMFPNVNDSIARHVISSVLGKLMRSVNFVKSSFAKIFNQFFN